MVDEVSGVNPVSRGKYTMKNLGIKEGSIEASLFNKIDMSDGAPDGELTDDQYKEYQAFIRANYSNKGRRETALEKLHQRYFPVSKKESDKVELLKIEAGLAEDLKKNPHGEYIEIKKNNILNKEEIITKIKSIKNREHIEIIYKIICSLD